MHHKFDAINAHCIPATPVRFAVRMADRMAVRPFDNTRRTLNLAPRATDALIPIETRPNGTVLCAVEGAAYETRVVIPAPRNRHDFAQYA